MNADGDKARRLSYHHTFAHFISNGHNALGRATDVLRQWNDGN
jgi:hypothetical protein